MAKKQNEPEFPRAELIAAAPALFGVPSELMAGALYDVETATTAQAKELLDKFMKREVS